MLTAVGSSEQHILQTGTTVGLCETDLTTLRSVRCCADQPETNVASTTTVSATATASLSSAAITEQVSSISTCATLGWSFMWGNVDVCGSSLASCNYASTYDEANQLCGSAGARLCSSAELERNVVASTGCGIDSMLTWSSTSCDAGHVLRMGSATHGAVSTCADNAGVYAVRCCADP